MMYKLVVQVVLLYGSEIWVVTDAMMTVLEGFHIKTVERIVGIMAKRVNKEEIKWDSVEVELEVTGPWPIRDF